MGRKSCGIDLITFGDCWDMQSGIGVVGGIGLRRDGTWALSPKRYLEIQKKGIFNFVFSRSSSKDEICSFVAITNTGEYIIFSVPLDNKRIRLLVFHYNRRTRGWIFLG